MRPQRVEAMSISKDSCRRALRCWVLVTIPLLWGLVARSATPPPPAGVAPIATPAGGFGIDGDLLTDSPTATVGDWCVSTNNSSAGGGAVLDAAGNPLDSSTTFHF